MSDFIFFCKIGDENGYLSNWWPAPFTIDTMQFKTAGHHMMFVKAMTMGDAQIAIKILSAETPAQVEALDRQVKNYDDQTWSQVRLRVVIEGNLAKFSQHPDLKQQLLETGDKILVEAADYDTIWGIGLKASDPRAQDPKMWLGQNLLGQALMAVRSHFRAQL